MREWDVIAAVAVGGIAGAEARYGLGVWEPSRWTTLGINVLGCLLMGVLMGWLERRGGGPRLARPLLGTGVLGGFTTFSAFSTDTVRLARDGRWGLAVGFAALTVVLCLVAVVIGTSLVRRSATMP